MFHSYFTNNKTHIFVWNYRCITHGLYEFNIVRHNKTHVLYRSKYYRCCQSSTIMTVGLLHHFVTSKYLTSNMGYCKVLEIFIAHGPLNRYAKFQTAHASGMPGTSPTLKHIHTCVTHLPRCMPGSLTSGFFVDSGRENVSVIPRACATNNSAYLVRGPLGGEWKGNIFSKSDHGKITTPIILRECIYSISPRSSPYWYHRYLLHKDVLMPSYK